MAMPEITVDELERLSARTVIDVREPHEFAGGHVPGATNVPLGTVLESAATFADAGPVHVICQSGGRSAKATDVLRAEGVDTVNVVGGTSAWLSAGHAVQR